MATVARLAIAATIFTMGILLMLAILLAPVFLFLWEWAKACAELGTC